MNRMSVQDASFLHIESDDRPMHVGGGETLIAPEKFVGFFGISLGAAHSR